MGEGDEVEGVLGLAAAVGLVDKGAAAGEAVVDLADEGLADVDVGRLVEQHAEEGLRGAGVLDRLRGEEDVLGGRLVEGAVEGAAGRGVRLVGWVFEEEDDAVEGLEGVELRGVEGQELFKLHILDAEVLDEGGEDALFSEQGGRSAGNASVEAESMLGDIGSYRIGFNYAEAMSASFRKVVVASDDQVWESLGEMKKDGITPSGANCGL
ncbi:hypothetical protein G7046_g6804 [Stylonectria norvegica]|nr:hypothetical protein G7046_g6804 [Stylonectria norvegica]